MTMLRSLTMSPTAKSDLMGVITVYYGVRKFKQFGEVWSKDLTTWTGFRIPTSQMVNPIVFFTSYKTVAGRVMSGITYKLGWPFTWTKTPLGWIAVFPDSANVSATPVAALPDDWAQAIKPRQTDAKVTATPREIRQHAESTRRAASRKLKQHVKRLHGPWLPSTSKKDRPNPFQAFTTLYTAGEGVYSSGYPENYFEAPVQSQVYYRYMVSVRTPGFRSLRRRQLPVNPFSCTIVKTNDTMGFDLRNGPEAWTCSYRWFPSSTRLLVPAAPTHDVRAYNVALRRIIDSAEIQLNGNLAQDLAQWSQTTRLIGDTAMRLSRAIKEVRLRNFETAAWTLFSTSPEHVRERGYPKNVAFHKGHYPSVSKSLADNWLAFQYGWKPLLQDIEGSMRSLADYYHKNPNLVRTARASASFETETVVPIGNLSTTFTKCGDMTVITKSSCKIGFRYTVASRLTQFLAQTGFTNPINLLWEVLPYSFVVDWFLPIGPYLETLSAYHGLAFQDGFVTKFTSQSTFAAYQYKGYLLPPNAAVKWDTCGRYSRLWLQLDRTKLSDFPTSERPMLKNPFSTTHALNALALLKSSFRPGYAA